ncbi:nuclear transport factor 2 family protein [Streptomyces barringtoniae]|uniref:nuclear transport factor 2 family protein n=1 Tax=Streptomyces barringtoniae TaxID=2892029 RepID=UPI001E62322E|nr:nuclear transport factor 2 family protein [Streptomyces barringtoniae]MCC5475973.1 ester cyclase [Streptomyces barringtoniae]
MTPTPTPTPTSLTSGTDLTPATGIALFDRWTALWNGDFSDPEAFLAPGFRIRFGNDPERGATTDAVHGPAGILRLVAAFREEKPGLRFTVDGTPVVDGESGRAACCWYVTLPDGVQKSGIDLLEVTDGRIATVWSVTGLRRFAN